MVTEQWDTSQVRGKFFLRLAGYLRRHPANLEKTLAKLEAHLADSGRREAGNRGFPDAAPRRTLRPARPGPSRRFCNVDGTGSTRQD